MGMGDETSMPGMAPLFEYNSVKPLFLAGPTAAGKSEVALRLGEMLGGEIISVDSMQVYRGLDIGTAKPTPADRQRVPHHLIDVVDLTESFDAARFVQLARRAVDEIRGRGRTPIFCGGTGLYFKAFLEGLGSGPVADPQLRAQLEATPIQTLLAELEQRDPITFERIDRRNPRRVIRALEVIRQTGHPFSEQRAAWSPAAASLPPSSLTLFWGLQRASEDLLRRINARVEKMFERGLVKETELLLEAGLERNRTALQALGYRQVVEHLRGERGLSESIALVKLRTRQYAKRQMTWFRRQARVEWFALSEDTSPEKTARQIATAYKVRNIEY
jgi:tRNA dimethylallyltransferase